VGSRDRGLGTGRGGRRRRRAGENARRSSGHSRVGSEDFKTYFLCLLAETLAKGGKIEAALDVVTEALGAVERSGERFYAAELHRQKGELLLMTGHDLAGVARCFGTAAEIARHQRAWALERRALQSFDNASVRPGRGV
jgi:predicted ATPase